MNALHWVPIELDASEWSGRMLASHLGASSIQPHARALLNVSTGAEILITSRSVASQDTVCFHWHPTTEAVHDLTGAIMGSAPVWANDDFGVDDWVDHASRLFNGLPIKRD